MFTTLLLSLLTATTCAAPTQASDHYKVTLVNGCTKTVWPAGWQMKNLPGQKSHGADLGFEYRGSTLAPGQSWITRVPKSALGVQFWAREGCRGDPASPTSFRCDVGDCAGYGCTELNWRGGVIMAEFGAGLRTGPWDTDITSYDISAIGGNNVGMSIVPTTGECKTKKCPVSGCAHDQAWQTATDGALGFPADTICADSTDFVVTFCPK